MHLDEMFFYKNQLLEDLLTDEEIVHLINENVEPENAQSLVYSQVMPYEFFPDTIEHAQVYVCCDVDIRKSVSTTSLVYHPTLYIWVFVHKDLLRLHGGGVRTDRLCHLIDKKINGSFKYGLGKLELQSVNRFSVVSDYTGKVMAYSASDFQKVYDPKKEVPSKRR